ncbi:MAG: outer membrane protein assembly factor BamB [Burkholderiaceae bacterium]|nr:outer membrane protein assembly factor BamB [Burkholderiaceae bacterium]
MTVLAGCSAFTGDDGRNNPTELKAFEPALSVQAAWRAPVGSGTGIGFAPVIGRDTAYAAAADGSVGKYDLTSGAAIWRVQLDTKLSAGVGSDGVTTAVVARDGTVIALDETGAVKWRAKATSDVSIPPIVGFGVVVVRSGDYRIQAFNAQNGERVWSIQRPGPALSLRAPSRMILAEGLIITAIPGGKLIAVNATSGDIAWEGIVGVPKGTSDLERVNDVVGAPVILGPLLCAASYQGKLTCFDVSQGGRPAWSKDFSSTAGIASDGKYIYSPSQRDIVNAFQLDNGALAWRQDALRNRRLAGPAANGQAVVVGDSEGFVHFLSPDDGRLVARLSLGGGPIQAPLQATLHGVLVQLGDSTLVMLTTN